MQDSSPANVLETRIDCVSSQLTLMHQSRSPGGKERGYDECEVKEMHT
jgi:hypothetical protein